MKKRLLISFSSFIILVFGLQAQKIASFEGDGSDIFNQFYWKGTDGSFGIVDNPSKTGINTTNKCLLNHRIKGTSSGWKTDGSITNSPLTPVPVTSTNRYLHVLVYSDQSYSGYIKVRYTAADSIWLDPSKEVRFNFTPGKWTDIVLDLQSVNVTSIYGLYFLSEDWYLTYPTDSYFYYDEIEVTNDPNPRGATDYEAACTVANFETNGIVPSYSMSGTSGGSIAATVDNPVTNGANETAKVLQITEQNETTWWSRATITFDKPVKVNNNTRYLHVMVKSPNGLSLVTEEPSEHWNTLTIPLRNEWCDAVFDLIGTANIPANTLLQSAGFCGNTTTNIPDGVWSVDEIAFSGDPSPRPRIKPTVFDSIICNSVIPSTIDGQFVNINPVSTINLSNTGKTNVKFILNIDVRTTANDPYRLTKDTIVMAGGETKAIRYELTGPEPGFYRYNIDVTDTPGTLTEHKFHRQIVYNYELIPTTIDAQPDFDNFWKVTKDSLEAVKPEYNVTFYENYGSHIIYKVSMKSIKGSTINGYLSVPNKPGKFPAVVVSEGYWLTCQPSTRTDDWVIINYNIRGQGISTAAITNTDVDLTVDGLKDKNTYYYKYAFMDALRAVDFAFSRPEIDTTKVFAEGASQGGALTYAIAALDQRIAAAAPTIPFLSDFPMYYKIKENINYIDEWPMNLLNIYMKKYSLSLATTLQNWSYFDIKNLAEKIKCPILTGSGLQDPTCPPALGMADYNNLQCTKEHFMYESYGHDVSSDFYTYRDAWFNQIAASLTGIIELKTDNFSDEIQTYITGNTLNIKSIINTPIQFSVYQTDGVLVNRSNLQGSSSVHLNSGVYIVCLKSSQDQTIRKIIVQ